MSESARRRDSPGPAVPRCPAAQPGRPAGCHGAIRLPPPPVPC